MKYDLACDVDIVVAVHFGMTSPKMQNVASKRTQENPFKDNLRNKFRSFKKSLF